MGRAYEAGKGIAAKMRRKRKKGEKQKSFAPFAAIRISYRVGLASEAASRTPRFLVSLLRCASGFEAAVQLLKGDILHMSR